MPQLYLLTAPEQTRQAGQWGLPLAHLAYGMGQAVLALTVGALSLTARRGWMVLTDRLQPDEGDPAAFAAQVEQECRRRQYSAVMADFERPANDRAFAILSALTRQGLPLIVPAVYGDALPGAQVLVDSAISGGDWEDYLSAQLARWPGRVVLALHPLRMRFPLPCPGGEGTPLHAGELAQALDGRQSFFSRELACRYCTCREADTFSFVLFDDAASLQYKLRLAGRHGVQAAAALYPEVAGLLPELTAGQVE